MSSRRRSQAHRPCMPTNPSNVCFRVNFGDEAAVDRVFSAAHHVTSIDIRNQRLSANPIEPRAAVGVYEPAEDSYTLYCTSQNPHGWRQMIAGAVLHVPRSQSAGGLARCRRRVRDEGRRLPRRRVGAVGGATHRRPVKWVAPVPKVFRPTIMHETRRFMGSSPSMPMPALWGFAFVSKQAVGSYIVSAACPPPMLRSDCRPSVYQVPAFFGSVEVVFTHTSPTSVYRGAGRPEAAYLMERMLDTGGGRTRHRPRRSATTKPDRARTNAVLNARPVSSTTVAIFAQLLDRCLALADWDGLPSAAPIVRSEWPSTRDVRCRSSSSSVGSSTTGWRSASTRAGR